MRMLEDVGGCAREAKIDAGGLGQRGPRPPKHFLILGKTHVGSYLL